MIATLDSWVTSQTKFKSLQDEVFKLFESVPPNDYIIILFFLFCSHSVHEWFSGFFRIKNCPCYFFTIHIHFSPQVFNPKKIYILLIIGQEGICNKISVVQKLAFSILFAYITCIINFASDP
jgi:hypothetical protein